MNTWKILAGIAVLALLVQVGLMATVLFSGRASPQFFSGPDGMMRSYHGQMMAGYGRMMGYGSMGPGMMDNRTGPLSSVAPLSVEDATAAVEGYLARLEDPDLAVKEVIVFTNHAYAQMVEKSTGIGAFEVLVDPVTRAVTPEPGPNMMWNLKYGHMAGAGGIGMMMGPYRGYCTGRMMEGFTPPQPSAGMPVAPEDSMQAAQRYLDAYWRGAAASGLTLSTATTPSTLYAAARPRGWSASTATSWRSFPTSGTARSSPWPRKTLRDRTPASADSPAGRTPQGPIMKRCPWRRSQTSAGHPGPC